MKTTTINTHRHHGNAALSFGGPTIYLDQTQAAWLRDRLDTLVKDIENVEFERSTLRPTGWESRITCGRDPITAYLDWTNNYLTVGKFAEDYDLDIDTAHELIKAGRVAHEAAILPEFTVVAVSSNTNAFGLRQVILLAPTGEGWKVCRTSQFCPAEGDVVKGRDFSAQGFELCSQLETLDAATTKKILALHK